VSGLVAIAGAPGTGKSVALAQRAALAARELAAHERAIVSAASALSARRLARDFADPRILCAPLGDVAFAVLASHAEDFGATADLAAIDDARAEALFSRIGVPLFALDWDEFVSAELDPEIPGMRAPERFVASAYRLIRKLRMAGMSPEAFVQAALHGATAFYGRPPNFANLELIERTPAKYRDSLRVSASELARQHAREVDLARILGRLYEAYVNRLNEHGCLTRIDAIAEAARLLAERPAARAVSAARYRLAFIDDAQDLTAGDVRFLRALFGDALAGVTVAGDPEQRTLGFAGPRGEDLFARAEERIVLEEQRRSSPGVVAAARAALDPDGDPLDVAGAATAVRFDSMQAEAAFVAGEVAQALASGVAPGEVAVIARSLRCMDPYLRALVARNVRVDPAGEGSLYAFADVEDALAALWSVGDPFRHDWLMRNLEAPWLRLSDASIALLCSEPADAQTALFTERQESEDERGRRWDRRRDVRLAWNVLRGERDGDLSATARERLAAFRAARRHWIAYARHASPGALARRIAADTALAGRLDDAAGHLRAGLVERLLRDVEAFAADRPRSTLLDYLEHVDRVARADDDLLRVDPHDANAVALLGVEAAKGREFARVFVVDARSGAFPRYYVPDTFGFAPRYGMIAKENVGEGATTARTAKFTYLQYKLDVPAKYYAEERRALYCAMSRARERVVVSASGRATRGRSAPEFVEELRRRLGEAEVPAAR
jgi:superfamily I DNA/RNA helicase